MKEQSKHIKSSQKPYSSAEVAAAAATRARQTLSKQERDQATNFQTVDRASYNVAAGKTPVRRSEYAPKL